jgi:hypothetical protein
MKPILDGVGGSVLCDLKCDGHDTWTVLIADRLRAFPERTHRHRVTLADAARPFELARMRHGQVLAPIGLFQRTPDGVDAMGAMFGDRDKLPSVN